MRFSSLFSQSYVVQIYSESALSHMFTHSPIMAGQVAIVCKVEPVLIET